jgi:hypothetical protein
MERKARRANRRITPPFSFFREISKSRAFLKLHSISWELIFYPPTPRNSDEHPLGWKGRIKERRAAFGENFTGGPQGESVGLVSGGSFNRRSR